MSLSDRVTVTKSEQKFTFLGRAVKLLPEDSIPTKRRATSIQLAEELQQIPKGKAVGLTENELGIAPYSMKVKIDRLKKEELLPKNFVTSIRKIDGKEILYIINSAKED